MIHPLFKDITLEAKYHPAQSGDRREWAYSLGNPSIPASWEITEINYRGFDITEFVTNHCEHLFQEYQEDLIQKFPFGPQE